MKSRSYLSAGSVTSILFIIALSLLLVSCTYSGRSTLLSLLEAENQVVTDEGRHFVSTGGGLFELFIEESGDSTAQLIGMEECGVNGLAVFEQWLIAACNQGSVDDRDASLWAGLLQSGQAPVMTRRFQLGDFTIVNGLAVSTEGILYIADYSFFATGGLDRLQLSMEGPELVFSEYQEDFLGPAQNVLSPNGLKFVDSLLYFTDYDASALTARLSAVDLNTLQVTVKVEAGGVFVDLTPICNGFVAANFYYDNNLTLINAQGETMVTPENEFSVTSSVLVAPSDTYPPNSLLITERGPLAGGGGAVSLYTLSSVQHNFLCSQ